MAVGSLIVCHWFVIEFCRYLTAPGVPEGVSPTRRDAVAEGPCERGLRASFYAAKHERQDRSGLRWLAGALPTPGQQDPAASNRSLRARPPETANIGILGRVSPTRRGVAYPARVVDSRLRLPLGSVLAGDRTDQYWRDSVGELLATTVGRDALSLNSPSHD